MRETVREAFERLSADYDARFPGIIPRYAEFHETVVRIVALHLSDGGARGTFVDLGCGTGELSRRLLEALPGLRLHGVDVSPAMVARARAKLAPFGDRASVEVGDALSARLPVGLAGVVAALAVHHLSAGEKRALFQRLLGALPPGGIFVLADAVQGESPRTDALYTRVWIEHMRGSGMAEEEVASVLADHARNDRFSRLEEQVAWMREAGFAPVECVWKHYLLVVVSAEKPAGERVQVPRRSAV